MSINEHDDAVARSGDVPRETLADLEPKARALLTELLTRLGVQSDIQTTDQADPDRLYLEITGPDTEFVIGRQGQVLDALEYLVNRIVTRGPGSPRVCLDAGGYRVRRAESLEHTARDLAKQARESGQAAVSGPLNARDRRIIHLALQDETDVSTESEGADPYRRVVVSTVGASSRIRPNR